MLYTSEYPQSTQQGERLVEQAIQELAAVLSHQAPSRPVIPPPSYPPVNRCNQESQKVLGQDILFDLQVGAMRWLLLGQPKDHPYGNHLYQRGEERESNRRSDCEKNDCEKNDCEKNEDEREESSLLSPREQEIAAMVANGHANKTIAAELAISVWTINTYMRRIFAKLGVNTRAAMIARLAGEGMLTR